MRVSYTEEVRERVSARWRAHIYCANRIISILYECPCKTDEVKQNHHFDYNRPLEVIRLCPKCHGAEHVRLRALKKITLICFKCSHSWHPDSDNWRTKKCPSCGYRLWDVPHSSSH